jgi:AcrR family transcriptional regulator
MSVGRKRSFEKNVALNSAMQVFWKNGYSGTTLLDLTKAMGIKKPSLYAAFGNKEALFNSALKLYLEQHGTVHAMELQRANKILSDRIYCYLLSISKMITNNELPKGCFIAGSTCDLTEEGLPLSSIKLVTEINDATKSALILFFEAEIAKGHLSAKHTPIVLAEYILTQQFGLAVMAKNNKSLKELETIVKFISLQF